MTAVEDAPAKRKAPKPPTPREIIAKGREDITLAKLAADVERLVEIRTSFAFAAIDAYMGAGGPTFDYASVSVEARDEMREAVAYRAAHRSSMHGYGSTE